MEAQKSKLTYFDLQGILQKNQSCVLATITSTKGSSPQKSGSSALFSDKKLLAGTVGGGPTELAISELAKELIRTKKSGYYNFDLDNDINNIEAGICGGKMSILIDAQPERNLSTFKTLNESFYNRIPGVLITDFYCKNSDPIILDRYWLTNANKADISKKVKVEVCNAAVEMMENRNRNDFKEIKYQDKNEKRMAFLELVIPLPQLIVAGAGHVGKALSHIGKLLDFEVIVWDDRPEFANAENLPDVDKILNGTINSDLAKFQPKKDSSIVIATRGHKNDADVLRHFIKSEAGYIGMIGSRKKIAQVRDSFIKNGWATEEEWERIYSPIGLEIGSKTVQEIAISIAAQLIMVRNQHKKS